MEWKQTRGKDIRPGLQGGRGSGDTDRTFNQGGTGGAGDQGGARDQCEAGKAGYLS